jgi:hypothetical protein
MWDPLKWRIMAVPIGYGLGVAGALLGLASHSAASLRTHKGVELRTPRRTASLRSLIAAALVMPLIATWCWARPVSSSPIACRMPATMRRYASRSISGPVASSKEPPGSSGFRES